MADFNELEGKRIKHTHVNDNSTIVTLTCYGGNVYQMYHEQDCCENVYLADGANDLNKLTGKTILRAYSSSNSGQSEYDGTYTWTFYHIVTITGKFVTLRWIGESNGYYSEAVSFELIEYR